ncbi:hypothetical protein BKA62DRAFT_348491 [Auriculariales sp. MPI-PUGE-AT-0066]|nr:hypothetical protein BKA62DRAFT_348491 [Auriculariales sp. MPI-PUGE-AT-0066]
MTPRVSPTPPKPTPRLYMSPEFVLCAGCILFHFPLGLEKDAAAGDDTARRIQVCILHHLTKDEWMLPKGRKDEGESIEQAAVRETYEETGYPCNLLPIDLQTRSPPRGVNIKDNAQGWMARHTQEPFMISQRTMGSQDQKFTFWFVAQTTEDPPMRHEGTQTDSENFDSHFLEPDAAIAQLTFEGDREVVRNAVQVVRATYFPDTNLRDEPSSSLLAP